MACHAPIAGWKKRETTADGKRAVTFRMRDGYSDLPVNLRCGKCAGCRMDKAREWAVRCSHEASLWGHNVFITLTYSEMNLPKRWGVDSLCPRDFVLFMKKLRKVKDGVRFLQAGEYGKLGRPHHHALLFNCKFDDAVFWCKSGLNDLYRSAELEGLWPFGFSSVGEVTFESAGYVARYTTKKMTAAGDWTGCDQDPVKGKIPEYMTMSRRPGIGAGWIEKYFSEVYPSDQVVVKGGKVMRPPRYYDLVAEKCDSEMFKQVCSRRERELSDEMKSGLRNHAQEVILKQRLHEEKGKIS